MITKFLINHICKTHTNGDDIANALDEGAAADAEAWKLKMKISKKDPMTQPAKCRAEMEQSETLCTAEVDSWIRQKDTMRSNIG
jgi:hypothetical protein